MGRLAYSRHRKGRKILEIRCVRQDQGLFRSEKLQKAKLVFRIVRIYAPHTDNSAVPVLGCPASVASSDRRRNTRLKSTRWNLEI